MANQNNAVVRFLKSEQGLAMIENEAPNGYSTERARRQYLYLLQKDQNNGGKLASCTPQSVTLALMQAAHLGLDFDAGHAHLIAYGKEATLHIDYKGLIKLAKNSGEVTHVEADVVRENDEFHFGRGTHNGGLEHRPGPLNKRGEIVGAYALFWLRNGFVKHEVLELEDIEAIRSVSRSGKSGPWGKWFGEMCKKAAIRRGMKTLELSPENMRAIVEDDRKHYGPAPLPNNIGELNAKLLAKAGGSEAPAESTEETVEATPMFDDIDGGADA